MAVNLLRNRNPNAPLGPFDGRVGALIEFMAETYFITTNTDYIPAFPPSTNAVYLRSDMRYGADDPLNWPQPFTETYPHLAAIAKREAREDLDVMWWQPSECDLIVGSAITRGLGRLRPAKVAPMVDAINAIVDRYRKYQPSAPNESKNLFENLIQWMVLALERLQMLPTTFPKMCFLVASLQRTYLELDALLEFKTVYQPRMKRYGVNPPSAVAKCMGTFTSDPETAQLLDAAGLPFWLMRPTHLFDEENILKIVPVLELPQMLSEERLPEQWPPVYSGNSTNSKIDAMRKASQQMAWYKDPFADELPSAHAAPTPEAGPSHPASPPVNKCAFQSNKSVPGGVKRTVTSSVCNKHNTRRGRNKSGGDHSAGGRDKFKAFRSPEMPIYLPPWIDALDRVDKRVPTSARPHDRHYLLPEPALLASPENLARRDMFVHHWCLLRDAIIYRIANLGDGSPCLSSQEWRDLLEGQIQRQGHRSSRMAKSRNLEDVIGPVLRHCGIDKLRGFPPPQDSIPKFTHNTVKQIIWEVAEVNFRFEIMSLDRRASGLDRGDEVRLCFAGGQLVDIPLKLSRKGLASPSPSERHRYYVRLAKLMLDWTLPDRPTLIARGVDSRRYSANDMEELERAVARYYTQSFFRLFGRAAVLPMALDHNIEPMPYQNVEECTT
ncbi:hypothetical protein B0H13DRAFT_2364676 [Mycena leptocephala]|nr:hypothetical protein B0H13DRAFT_2364676 [Mycena leptocephala]